MAKEEKNKACDCPEEGQVLVSVIMPAYNSGEYLEASIGSVLNQTYRNLEIIVIDDCSSDGTLRVARDLAEKDSRVKLLRNEKNGGAAIARNKGIKVAKGRYIAFLDADDLWKPEKLAKQIGFMRKNGVCFSYSDYDVLYPNGEIKSFSPNSSLTYHDLLKSNDIGCLTAIYDVEALGKIYMPVEAEKREDYAAWLQILKKTDMAKKTEGNLAVYRVVSNSVSSKKIKMMKYQYRLYRKCEGFSPIRSAFLTLRSAFYKMQKYR